MAQTPVRPLSFEYDDVTKELVVAFAYGPPLGTEDEASFAHDTVVTVRVSLVSVIVEPT